MGDAQGARRGRHAVAVARTVGVGRAQLFARQALATMYGERRQGLFDVHDGTCTSRCVSTARCPPTQMHTPWCRHDRRVQGGHPLHCQGRPGYGQRAAEAGAECKTGRRRRSCGPRQRVRICRVPYPVATCKRQALLARAAHRHQPPARVLLARVDVGVDVATTTPPPLLPRPARAQHKADKDEDSTLIDMEEATTLTFSLRYLNLFTKATGLNSMVRDVTGYLPLGTYRPAAVAAPRAYVRRRLNAPAYRRLGGDAVGGVVSSHRRALFHSYTCTLCNLNVSLPSPPGEPQPLVGGAADGRVQARELWLRPLLPCAQDRRRVAVAASLSAGLALGRRLRGSGPLLERNHSCCALANYRVFRIGTTDSVCGACGCGPCAAHRVVEPYGRLPVFRSAVHVSSHGGCLGLRHIY